MTCHLFFHSLAGTMNTRVYVRSILDLREQIMFTKAGLIELHSAAHERLDLLLAHIATMPEELWHKPIPGFGHPSIWKQLVHILDCEEGWIHDLQGTPVADGSADDRPKMTALLACKERIRGETRAYLGALTEDQLNTIPAERPAGWAGEDRTPAFILLHLITHMFHHKGQVVAMLRILGHPSPDTDLQRG